MPLTYLQKRALRAKEDQERIRQEFENKSKSEAEQVLHSYGLREIIDNTNKKAENKTSESAVAERIKKEDQIAKYNPSVKKDASNKDNAHDTIKIKKTATDENSTEQQVYERQNDYSVDNSEIIIQNIQNAKLSLMRELLEIMGDFLGDDEANVEYRNYMYDKVIMGTTKGTTMLGFGEFTSGVMIDPGSVGDTGISDGMLNIICQYETGKPFGYTMTKKDLYGYDLGDARGHKTFGYGLLYHPIAQKFMDTIKVAWSQSELETLFKVHAKKTGTLIDKWAAKHNIQLNQRQKDAIACACYNFGPGFLNKSVSKMIANNPNDPNIFNTWCHLSDVQGRKYPGLIKRRQMEASWYFGK